ncbi:argininosuccinate lyase [Roseobacter sp. HKCCD9010]|jgi:hypothetical protein|nr:MULTISPECIES: argininosuccinate lyase [unclassified Roseobacter]MBF9050905.1 argininosuccinate lyase [Rhodobacterales bacterium HKCCD4356]NNV12674.1 argininosuccinate lyase [Roseobacter sp. HKCCD7357]NNV16618.1 argininosuccinate lyase [Roseobacter sp. HKCCD8768]NNV26750.1 argininosuccinate lyase [Roseobacter sp. HKCCD8192]NNV30337.1 argininosuccinate lyase [Roseobacter sp. HKCCD9061]
MIRLIAPILMLGLLAACGVDGDPIPPEPPVEPGITISGTVEAGITGGS